MAYEMAFLMAFNKAFEMASSFYTSTLLSHTQKTMDKSMEVIMNTAIAVLIPLIVVYLQDSLNRRKEARDLASKQARRDEIITHDIGALKSTTDKMSVVLDRVDSRLDVMGERIAHLEGRATQ